jgi:negative regulator of sigma-B (phosphoserine phosphatase)
MTRQFGDNIGFFSLPCIGEVVCGDGCFMAADRGRIRLALFDGAGHGETAHEVSARSEDLLTAAPMNMALGELVDHLHKGIQGSRGLAAILVDLQSTPAGWICRHVGIGDVRLGYVHEGRWNSLSVEDGVIGSAVRTPLVHSTILDRGDCLMAFSDGVQRSAGDQLAGLGRVSKAVNRARQVVMDHKYDYDDASALVFQA